MIISNQHFDIQHILECGQSFRYTKLDDFTYEIIAYGKRVKVTQNDDQIDFECDTITYNEVWRPFFDLEDDYGLYKDRLIKVEPKLAEAIQDKWGIRILRQEPFEMLITFILSQNKSMPQIKVLVERLARTYGTLMEDNEGSYHRFPTPEQLAHVTDAEFRNLKVGFRAPYLIDAVHKVLNGYVDLEAIYKLDSSEARVSLMTIKGVGRKVSDCILLFAYHKLDVFPLDVWMKRIVNHLYGNGQKLTDQCMLDLADEHYGNLAGLAQQYLFYHYIKKL